ncbi:hypothetical protein KXD40_002432 [Peronospora effusa]|uniref:Uncharacterized protein n=1 Tax=Peronospora effusa TaxID=542832 RepID=A0A425BXE9_9STRA|nr:hypothetical protein DD237_007492 [Peronospora effusa]UIZ26908.1 hypothetical protein KXD40_002432 [Peronospora effusa]CAI5704025.1 unnamed protein product [Peronospora effusa]
MENNKYLLVLMALSATGTCLVPVFGLLVRFQPQFTHGLDVHASNAEMNCYIVGTLYAGVFLICGFMLKTRDCLSKKRKEAVDDITKRNERYKLPFPELENKEFVRAMDAMDRRATVVAPIHKKALELLTMFPDKVMTV